MIDLIVCLNYLSSTKFPIARNNENPGSSLALPSSGEASGLLQHTYPLDRTHPLFQAADYCVPRSPPYSMKP